MSTKKILYVEDNDDNVYMLKPRLERKGYEVFIAEDGKEGIYLTNNKNPDLILMDLELPFIDGWEAIQHIKNDPNTKHIPIIALSARILEEDKSRAFEAGCDDFESKPVDFETLVKKIQSYIPEETESNDDDIDVTSKNEIKILIVDDDDNDRFTLSEYLKREGFSNYELAEDGEIAINKLTQSKIDLVLLDVKMPNMDGIEVLRKLKKDENLRNLPVIMISGADEIENVTECIEIGAEGFLSKPFNSMLLRARINASLNKKKIHDEDYLENIEEGKKHAEKLQIANEMKATKCARTYFRVCLFIPLIFPLPFLLFNIDPNLSSLFMSSLIFAMPPYFLFILIPFLFLLGKMTEKHIITGIIFFPIIFPLIFGLFWIIAPPIISAFTSITISLTDHTQWIFTTIVIPAAYAIIFLSGYIIRRKLIKWEEL